MISKFYFGAWLRVWASVRLVRGLLGCAGLPLGSGRNYLEALRNVPEGLHTEKCNCKTLTLGSCLFGYSER